MGPGEEVPSAPPCCFLSSLPVLWPAEPASLLPHPGVCSLSSEADTLLGEGRGPICGHNTPVPAAGSPLLPRRSCLCPAPSHGPGPAVQTERPLGRRRSPGLQDLGPGCTGEGLMGPRVAAVAPAKTATFCSGVPVYQTFGHRCAKAGRREWFAHKEKTASSPSSGCVMEAGFALC